MREIIKNAMNTACHFSGKQPDDTTRMIWSIGLKKYSDEDIQDAIVNFCESGNTTFAMISPKEFMEYSDPYGHKAAQKRIEETRRMINGD